MAYCHTADVVGKDDQRAEIAPWRSAAWNDPAARQMRTRLSEQADELSRLREENALLRRWVSERLNANPVNGRGA